MSLSIRQATNQDIPALLNVLNSGVTNKVRRGDLAWGDQAMTEADVLPQIAKGNVYVAALDDAVVGTFTLDWQDTLYWGVQPPDGGYIQRFAVAGSHRGQNIGGQMLDLAHDEVAARGGHCLRLVCPAANPGLRAYYEKQGFSRADGKANPASYQPVVYYERSISSEQNQASPTGYRKPSLLKRIFTRNSE